MLIFNLSNTAPYWDTKRRPKSLRFLGTDFIKPGEFATVENFDIPGNQALISGGWIGVDSLPAWYQDAQRQATDAATRAVAAKSAVPAKKSKKAAKGKA